MFCPFLTMYFIIQLKHYIDFIILSLSYYFERNTTGVCENRLAFFQTMSQLWSNVILGSWKNLGLHIPQSPSLHLERSVQLCCISIEKWGASSHSLHTLKLNAAQASAIVLGRWHDTPGYEGRNDRSALQEQQKPQWLLQLSGNLPPQRCGLSLCTGNPQPP